MSLPTYIGGSFAGRDRIKKEADRLAGLNYKILSKWFDAEYFIEKAWNQDMGGDVAEAMARLDFTQILQAKLIIIDTIDKSSTGGSDTELGMAIMLAFFHDTRIVHIGPVRNIFQTMVLEWYHDWDEFILSGSKLITE